MAEDFKGFGPTLFQSTNEVWKALLGHDAGHAVFALIFSVRNQSGALRSTFTYSHYEFQASRGKLWEGAYCSLEGSMSASIIGASGRAVELYRLHFCISLAYVSQLPDWDWCIYRL